MQGKLVLVGTIAGAFGVIICAISGLARVVGEYYLAGYQSTTIFNVGVGLMVFACLIKLEALSAQQNQK